MKRAEIDAILEAERIAMLAYIDQFAAQQLLEHAAMVEEGERVTADAMALPEGRANDCPIDLSAIWPSDRQEGE